MGFGVEGFGVAGLGFGSTCGKSAKLGNGLGGSKPRRFSPRMFPNPKPATLKPSKSKNGCGGLQRCRPRSARFEPDRPGASSAASSRSRCFGSGRSAGHACGVRRSAGHECCHQGLAAWSGTTLVHIEAGMGGSDFQITLLCESMHIHAQRDQQEKKNQTSQNTRGQNRQTAACDFRLAGSGFRVQGSGFRVQVSEFRVHSSQFRVQESGFRVQGAGFRRQGRSRPCVAQKRETPP